MSLNWTKDLTKSLKLKKDGSNVKAWLFKLETVVKVESLQESFTYDYDPDLHPSLLNGNGEAKRVSVLFQPEYRRPFALLSPEQQESAVKPRDDDQKTMDAKAFALLSISIHDDNIHLISNGFHHPTVALCNILQEHMRLDDLSMIRLQFDIQVDSGGL